MPENENATPTPLVSAPLPKPNLAGAVNAAQGSKVPRPKSLTTFNTSKLTDGFFHGCIYGETDARKSTTAALFGSPEDVRIVLTRRPEQLKPLRNKGYEVALVEDEAALNYALMYPEQIWPDWAKRPDRTLVLDDATEAVAMLLDSSDAKDQRRSYMEAGDALRAAIQSTLKKPQHFVMTALAKVRSNPITDEERIGPDLPPSMLGFITTEMEYCFYIDKKSWKFITQSLYTSIKGVDDKGKERIFLREIFGKNKLELELVGKGILAQREDMNLQTIWKKIKEGKAPTVATTPHK